MGFIVVCICLFSWPYISTASPSRVRLVNGHGLPNQGRLEIYDDRLAVWGTVCDDLFDRNAAGVVCQQLGYSRLHAHVKPKAYFGEGSGRIAYDDVMCNGSETDLDQCQHARISDCTHSDDVGIICWSLTIDAHCNFEQESLPCRWTNIHNEDFDWTLHSGKTVTPSTGPNVDHTNGTTGGHYMYIESSFPRHPGDIARLVSPSMAPSHARCMHFWYHMHGTEIGTLNVLLSTSKENSTLWSMKGNQGNAWKEARVPVTSTHIYHLVIEGIRGSGQTGDIAIDDISFTQIPCLAYPASATSHLPSSLNCNFEQQPHPCQWTNIHNETFDWTLHNGETATSHTGPTVDHTKGTAEGHYMYIEASHPRHPGDIARLVSPSLAPSYAGCVQFWYHMYGATTGTLNVLLLTSNGNSTLWSMKGNQGNAWYQAQVPVTSTQTYYVVFEGIRGGGFSSDIAIDDISFAQSSCLVFPQAATSHLPPSPNCDFEQQSYPCQWANIHNEDFDWTLHSGTTPSSSTGPSVDHTIGTAGGHYMYIESSFSRHPGDIARLVSPSMAPSHARCMHFWYHMYGAATGTLNVLLSTSKENSTLWSMKGNQGNAWHLARVPVTSTQTYHVVIEGIRGHGFTSDIAIDDISITQSLCTAYPAAATSHLFSSSTHRPTTTEKPTTHRPTTTEKATTHRPTTTEKSTTLQPTTTEKTAPPISCHQCGNPAANTPCDLRDVYIGNTSPCTSGSYCMTDVVQETDNNVAIYKRCVDEQTCRNEWLAQTSNQDRCLKYAEGALPGIYTCHYCCTADGCNSQLVPESKYFYKDSSSSVN